MAVLTNPQLQVYSSRYIAFRIWAEGDSYVAGSGGASFAAALRAQGYVVISTAVGGSTMTDIRDRLIANRSALIGCSMVVVWDGSPNGYTTAEAYADTLQEGLDYVGRPFIVLPSAVPYGQTGTQAIPIRNEFIRRWPGQVCDWRGYIPNTDGVINQDMMLNYPTDAWHLNQTAYNYAGAGVAGMIE